MRRTFLATVIMVAALGAIHAICEPAIRLSVRPQSGFGRQNLHIELRVNPIESDRVLVIELDDGNYFRRTEIPLIGADSARLQSFEWRDVPAGQYVVVAVIGSLSRERSRDSQRVIFLPID